MPKSWIFILSIFFIGSCGPERPDNDKIKVVTTTSILSDICMNILPNHFQVEGLMGPGVDPHLYKASQGDITKVSAADVVVCNGLHLEGKMASVLSKLAEQKQVLVFADGIDVKKLRVVDENSGLQDPHVWFDLSLSYAATAHLIKSFERLYPQFKDSISVRGNLYLQKMKALETWSHQMFDSLPQEHKILITSHDAFGYFGQAYNFEVRGLQGISTLSESGLKDLTDMVNFIIDRKVKAVFVENSVPQKALKSVLEGCKNKGHEVEIGGELFSDALGQARTPEGTYLGMIKYNMNTINSALR
jgi:manganese/zinc/iron transport system substrate-binding protein